MCVCVFVCLGTFTGKCRCKERKVKSVSDLCRMKHSYGKNQINVYESI